MRWTKRLKWIRASKIVIPIALAISLVFAGFTFYAHEAEYFVLRINDDTDVKLALSMEQDYLKGQTSRLLVPVNATYEDATYVPDKGLTYNPNRYMTNLPDDIAHHYGEHSVYENAGSYSFYSFSFWLINNSERAVDIDMRFNIDSMVLGANNNSDKHIDEAVRVMIIEGNPGPLLSENQYLVYKKPEKTAEEETALAGRVAYGNTVMFESDICVFNRAGDLGYKNVREGEALRFTVVIWLEGEDYECQDEILSDSLRMSIDFTGH